MKNSKVKKTFSIIGNVLVFAFLILSLFFLILTLSASRDSDGTATLFGYQMRIVLSPSMEKCDETDVSEFEIKSIKTKSAVFIKTVPTDTKKESEFYENLKVGDVLTFKYVYDKQETITHRITNIQPKLDAYDNRIGYIINLSGDNKNSNSDTLTQVIDTSLTNNPNYVIGKVVGTNYALGVVVSTLQSTAGLVCIIIIPSALIIVIEIIRVIKTINDDKKKKQQIHIEEQKEELETLRKRLKELEEKNSQEDIKE